MHKVVEGKLNKIKQPTVLFYHTNDIKIPELADAATELT